MGGVGGGRGHLSGGEAESWRQGFSSETEFDRYVKYDRRSHKVLAAVVFDCDFTSSNDPLPLQVKYHLRFVRLPRSFSSRDVFNWKTSLLFPYTTSAPRNPADDDGGSPGNVAKHILESQEYRFFSIIALSIEVENNKTLVTILFNNEAYHSPATSLAVLDSVLFMSLSGPTASIKVSNKPQPLHQYDSHLVPMEAVQIVLCLAFGMAIVFAGFGFQTVMERTTKAKHVQFVSGAYVLTYWLSALLCDLICFSILCCLFLGVLKYCEVDALVEDYHFLDTMMIFMLYSWSVVPLMYLGSFVFSSSAVAFVKLTLFNYFSTLLSIITDLVTHYDDSTSRLPCYSRGPQKDMWITIHRVEDGGPMRASWS